MPETTAVQMSRYAIQHVNYGSDDGSPSSKFIVKFDSPSYEIARKAMDAIVSTTPYRKSRLLLLHLDPQADEHIPGSEDREYGPNSPFQIPPPEVKRKHNHYINHFTNKQAVVSPSSIGSGRYIGRKCRVTGCAYLSPRIKTIRRIALFSEEWEGLGHQTSIRYDLIVEIKMKGTTRDKVWIAAHALRFKEPEADAMRLGLMEMIARKVVNCPYCKSEIFTQDHSMGVSGMKSGNREEHIRCYVCTKKFLMVRAA